MWSCFSDIEFKPTSQEIIPEIVYDSRTENITDYINDVFDYWEDRKNRETVKLSKADVKDIVNYLSGDFTFIPTIVDLTDVVFLAPKKYSNSILNEIGIAGKRIGQQV